MSISQVLLSLALHVEKLLDGRNRQRDRDDDGGDQAECGGWENVRLVGQRDQKAIDDRAEHGGAESAEDAALPEKGFANDDGREPDDEHADAAGNICKLLILCEDPAGKGDDGVGKRQCEDLCDADVDGAGADHVLIIPGSADGKPNARFEEGVNEEDRERHEHEIDEGFRQIEIAAEDRRCEAEDRVDADEGEVGLGIHGQQVHRIKPAHREDPGEDRRNAQVHIQRPCHHPG